MRLSQPSSRSPVTRSYRSELTAALPGVAVFVYGLFGKVFPLRHQARPPARPNSDLNAEAILVMASQAAALITLKQQREYRNGLSGCLSPSRKAARPT